MHALLNTFYSIILFFVHTPTAQNIPAMFWEVKNGSLPFLKNLFPNLRIEILKLILSLFSYQHRWNVLQ